MKGIIIILFIMLGGILHAQVTPGFVGIMTVPISAVVSCSCVYTTTLTIDHTKCGSTDDANFPVIVNYTDVRFKDLAHSGYVYRSDGHDIEFYGTGGDTTSLLSWWIESYNPATGLLIAHVKIANVSASSDTKFYMRYGMTWINHSNGANGTAYSNNYIGFWPLSESTGSNNLDYSGNNYTLAPVNSPVQTSGQIDGALQFTAASSMYTGTTNIAAMDGIGNETIEYWGKRSAANNIVKVGKTTSTYNMVEEWSDGFIYMAVTSNNTQYAWPTNSGDRANDGNWHHIVLTWDGSQSTNATKMKYYLDGSSKSLSFNGGTWTSTVTGTALDFFIGKGESTAYSNGTIDNVSVRSATSSADWVLKRYNNGNAPTTFITLNTQSGPSN